MYTEVANGIYYTGVNERTLKNFENIWPIPEGMSYNSYLVVGEKIALIDSTGQEMHINHRHKIQQVIQNKPIDYLVINHMEPDHSAGIADLVNDYPNITIIGNEKTIEYLKGYYDIVCDMMIIKDGDELELGSHTLKFYLTPMLHWPETMMTYEKKTNTLFSGDAFGGYGALNGNILDTDIDTTLYYREMRRYYATIVGKYGVPVQQAIKKLNGLTIKTICSTHGPVWKRYIKETVGYYDQYSKFEAEDGVVIAWGSMYGGTTLIAEEIASQLAEAGVKNIVMYDLNVTDLSYVLSSIFQYNTLILGSSVYNGDILPTVKSLISAIEMRGIKNRNFGCFGTYTWGGSPLQKLEQVAETMSWNLINPLISQRYRLNREGEEEIKKLAELTKKLF